MRDNGDQSDLHAFVHLKNKINSNEQHLTFVEVCRCIRVIR